jgi:hypothetical protein
MKIGYISRQPVQAVARRYKNNFGDQRDKYEDSIVKVFTCLPPTPHLYYPDINGSGEGFFTSGTNC